MTDDLKPCPFCGGNAEITRYGTRSQSMIYNCLGCGCILESNEASLDNYRWNTRPPHPAETALRELVEAIEAKAKHKDSMECLWYYDEALTNAKEVLKDEDEVLKDG